MGTGLERGWLRGKEKALVGRSETWTKGGTGEGPQASALLRPVNLRSEDYKSQRALLPSAGSQSYSAWLNFHPGWAHCTLGRVVVRESRAVPEIPLAACRCVLQPVLPPGLSAAESRGICQIFIPLPVLDVSPRAGRMRLTRPQLRATPFRD